MESIRGSSVRVAVSLSNKEAPANEGSHCLIEWDEPNNPVSVVERKNVVSVGGVSIGEMCSVRCRERGKWIQDPGKLLSQGSKREMELHMLQLDDLESGSEDDECAQAEKGVEGQAVTHKVSKKKASAIGSDNSEDEGDAQPPRKEQLRRKKRKTGDTIENEQPLKKKQRQIAIASKPSKKKVAEENMRITEQLLNGLVSPEKSPPRDDKNEDQQPPIEPKPPQKGFVLASDLITLSDDFNLDSDLTEPDNSFLTSTRDQHTLTLKDAASTVKENTVGWDHAVQAQLDNLKQWLELQFTALNGKIDAIVEKHRRHRKVYQDAASTSEMEEKENCLIQSTSAAVAGPSTIGQVATTTTTNTAAGPAPTSPVPVPVKAGKLEIVCGNPKSRQHLVLPLPSEAAVALFHSINCCLPLDPGTFAKKLLDVFFSEEKLARSCCTKAVGRELLDQNILCGIKYQTSYKYHIPKDQLEETWSKIVKEKLNMRCRTCRRKLAEKQEKME